MNEEYVKAFLKDYEELCAKHSMFIEMSPTQEYLYAEVGKPPKEYYGDLLGYSEYQLKRRTIEEIDRVGL